MLFSLQFTFKTSSACWIFTTPNVMALHRVIDAKRHCVIDVMRIKNRSIVESVSFKVSSIVCHVTHELLFIWSLYVKLVTCHAIVNHNLHQMTHWNYDIIGVRLYWSLARTEWSLEAFIHILHTDHHLPVAISSSHLYIRVCQSETMATHGTRKCGPSTWPTTTSLET